MLREMLSAVRAAAAHELRAVAFGSRVGTGGPKTGASAAGPPSLCNSSGGNFDDVGSVHRLARHALLVPLLTVASSAVEAAATCRLWLYQSGWLSQTRLPVPVISIGNLTWGGNGKTSIAELVALRCWEAHGRVPLLLSRGYQGGDEAEMLKRRLRRTKVRIAVGKDRVAVAMQELRKAPEIGVVVLDDGMQHLKLFRDLEICMVNAVRPFGNRRVLPLGPLRERPSAALPRCDAIIVHHAELLLSSGGAEALANLQAELCSAARPPGATGELPLFLHSGMRAVSCRPAFQGVCPPLPHLLSALAFLGAAVSCEEADGPRGPEQEGRDQPAGWNEGAPAAPREVLRGAHVVCLTGIGCPEALEQQLRMAGAAEVEGAGLLVDHQRASDALLQAVRRRVLGLQSAGSSNVVVLLTEKDAVKYCPSNLEAALSGAKVVVLVSNPHVSDLEALDSLIGRAFKGVKQ